MEDLKAEVLAEKGDKICFICEEKKAKFVIKGRPSDCYCKNCAIEHFSSIDYLEKI